MSFVLPHMTWTVSAVTEGAKNGGESLNCERKRWSWDSCGASFMPQTTMVRDSSQPRWTPPVQMGSTSWAIPRLRQSMAIISSLPFSGSEQLYPSQQWWENKLRLVCSDLTLTWFSVGSQALPLEIDVPSCSCHLSTWQTWLHIRNSKEILSKWCRRGTGLLVWGLYVDTATKMPPSLVQFCSPVYILFNSWIFTYGYTGGKKR